jgi:peptidoglycan/LPS O-acetylase OafA/YrhL
MNQPKLLNLESLRGIAAISVAMYHFNYQSHFSNIFVSNAWLMVDFFFVLSGFVIALNYERRLTNFGKLFTFQKKRFLRLYPLHFIMLVVFLVIEILKYILEIKLNIVANIPAFSINNLQAFIANVTLLHDWTRGGMHFTFNTPSWSISAEFYTYAIFGIVAVLTTKSKTLLYIISILLILTSGFFLYEPSSFSGPLRCIYSFFIGAMTHSLYRRFDLRDKLNTSFLGCIMLIFSIFLTTQVLTSFHSTVVLRFELIVIIPIIFALTVLSLVSTKNNTYINIILSNSKLVYLGTISYGIYMIHAAIWWVYRQLFKFVVDLPTELNSDGYEEIVFENIYFADLVLLSGIILIIILAHLSYVFVETKFNRPVKKKNS